MASIFQEVVLTWRGTEYRITPTMRLLNRIEQDVSLAVLAGRISNGDVPITHIATAVSIMLQSKGAKASAEDVYAELLGDDPEVVSEMAQAIMLAAFPTPKKSVDPVSRQPTPHKRATRKR